METSNGWLTSAHNPDVIMEIGSLQDPLYGKGKQDRAGLSAGPLGPRH